MGKPHVMKRADAIIRWLERLKKSYADGDTGNAYIEAECARADIEALTHDVIAGLTHTPKRSMMSYIFPAMRVFALSLAVVMSWALPLARDVVARETVADNISLPGMASEAVTDNDLLPGMAKNQSLTRDDTRQIRRKTSTPKTTPTKMPKNTQPAKAPKITPSMPAKTPAYDRLAHLTLTGQKALNNDNTTIIKSGRGNKNL